MLPGKRRNYTAHQFAFSWERWREDTRGKLPEAIVTSFLSLIAGVWGGTEGIVEGGIIGGLIGAVVGAVAGPLLVALVTYLWRFFEAPGEIWRRQIEEIEYLRSELLGRDDSAPTLPACMEFASIHYALQSKAKIYCLGLTEPAPRPHFHVFCDREVDGDVRVFITTHSPGWVFTPVQACVYWRREKSFAFEFQAEQNQPSATINISLQSTTPARIIEIKQL